jgi:DNA polymerase III subunit gamma/tau
VDVKLSEQPRYALEVALLEGVFLAPGAQVAELLARAEALAGGAPVPPRGGTGPGGTGPGGGTGTPGGGATGGRPMRSTPPRGGPSAGGSLSGSGSGEPAGDAGASPAARAGPAAGADSDADRWRAVVEEVEKATPRAGPALKEAALLSIEEGEIAVQLPAGILAETIERRREEIEATFARFFGRPTRLAVRTGPGAPGAGAGAAPAGAAAALSIAQAEAAERLARSSRVQEAARAHPNIREAAKILEGGIKNVEEL